MFKKLFLIFVVLAAAGGYYLYSNINGIIKNAVETYGSQATKTQVTLNAVKLSLTSGEGSLSGLKVGTPEGFESPFTIDLGEISVSVDKQSIADSSGPIVINKVIITAPKINYEVLQSGASNMQTIAANAQSYANGITGKAPPKDTEQQVAKETTKNQRKIIIDQLEIREGEITISQPMLPTPISTGLPTIVLHDIGRNKNGITGAEVAQQLLNAITVKSAGIATQNIAKQIGDQLKSGEGGLRDIGNSLKGMFGR